MKGAAATMIRIMDASMLLWLLAAVLVLVGLAGTLLPLLPGIPLMMAGMLIAAWADDFTRITWVTLVVLGVLIVATHPQWFLFALGSAYVLSGPARPLWARRRDATVAAEKPPRDSR